MNDLVLNIAQTTVDAVADRWPAPPVSNDLLKSAKIVAHRGAFGPGIKENLCSSLAACPTAGIWGVEFDVRWNRQEVPVLLHDPIPDRSKANKLEEAIVQLSGRCHLMIEVKEPLTPKREDHLVSLLKNLEPVRDYHILTLNPELLNTCRLIPKGSWVLVTETKARWASDYVLEYEWGGVAGHYLLMSDGILERHKNAGQSVGLGFIRSPNNLCRQLARGADWIFSNHAPLLQKWIKDRIEN